MSEEINESVGLDKIPLENLTEWANEPSVQDLQSDYKDALGDHDIHVTDVDAWLGNLNGSTKKFKPNDNRSKVVPKVIRKQAEWRYSSLSEPFLSTDDLFAVNPVTFEDKAAAEQNRLVINNQINTAIDKVAFVDEYIRTAVDEGTVIVKTGWDFLEEERTVLVDTYQYRPVQDPQAAQQASMKVQFLLQNPQAVEQLSTEEKKAFQISLSSGRPIEAVRNGTKEVTKKMVVKNQPSLEICEYTDLMIDPTCKGDLSKAEFIIHKFESSLSALKKDGRYKNLDTIDPDSILDAEDDDVTPSFKFKDKARKKVMVYEYWGFKDINDDGIVRPILGAYIGNTKVRMEENPFPDEELPFIKVKYLPVRNSNYGQPDGFLLEDNQDIIGAIVRGMVDIMARSANGQQGIRKDALDTANARRFERGEDYKFNANIDPNQAFHMGKYPEIPQSAMLMIDYQNREAESITGVKSFSQGITGSALGESVSNARGALDAASKRELGILRRLASGFIEIGRKFISMNAEFLEDEEIIRITNEEFVPVRRDDLAGNFDLKLSISTAESDNDKAQELAFMLQTLGNNQDPDMTRMIQAEIATLRKMPELAQMIKEYEPTPDPLMVKEQELKVALLEAQVRNENAKASENQVDMELKKAKIREIHSNSDQKDLDFLEQKGGTKHNREMDKQDKKMKGDQNLKTLDAAFKKDLEKTKGGFMKGLNI